MEFILPEVQPEYRICVQIQASRHAPRDPPEPAAVPETVS